MYSELINVISHYYLMQITKLEPVNETMMCIDSNTNDVLCNKLLSIVVDKYSKQILDTTSMESKSVTQIFLDAGIPISTVYQRLQNLLDAKLLHISGEINEDGEKLSLYKSKVKEIHTTVNGKTVSTILVLMSNNESV